MNKHDLTISNKRLVIYTSPNAWGDGEHETTRFMLNAIPTVPIEGKTVLDIGTGSGILSVLCGKLGAKHILALDINPVTLAWAEKNFKRNDVKADTEVHDCCVCLDGETADVVLSNLPPAEQYENMKHIASYVNEGGYIIMSLVKNMPITFKGFTVIAHFEGVEYDGYVLRKETL